MYSSNLDKSRNEHDSEMSKSTDAFWENDASLAERAVFLTIFDSLNGNLACKIEAFWG